jgi:hypothetical protein
MESITKMGEGIFGHLIALAKFNNVGFLFSSGINGLANFYILK